jgi:hypothetical protein
VIAVPPSVVVRCAAIAVAVLLHGQAFAQTDIAGEWASRLHEDQPHRQPGPHIGDYTGLPVNDAARLRADSWDASIQSVREHQDQPLTSVYGFHGIANLRVSKVVDPVTQQVVAYSIFRSPGTGGTRVIWMDGRARPPEYAPHTWQGFSVGRWNGGMLTVQTTHIKAGTIQRNGVPHTDRATVTEYFMRHGAYLTIVAVTDEPEYLEEPLVRSSTFVLAPDQQLEPVPGQVVDEIAGYVKGHVPHHLFGTNPYLREFAERVHLPYEVTRGGKATMYPEYRARLLELQAAVAATADAR